MTVSECLRCGRMFRDSPDTAGVCPCGFQNQYDDEEAANREHLRKVTW